MRYTLSIIRERLAAKGYDVRSIIYTEPKNDDHHKIADPDLSGIIDHWFTKLRMSEVPDDPERAALYISPAGDLSVNLMHGPFSFRVDGTGYNKVCEEVVEIFQALSEWESDLNELALSSADYQAMIDRSDGIFENPIFVCNWQGNVHGFSTAYANEWIRSTWKSITHSRRVPVSSLTAIMDSDYRNYLSQENRVHILDFPELDYKSVFGLVHVNSEIILQFQIIEYNRKLTVADLELAQVFLDSLRRSFRENDMAKHDSALDVFRRLMNADDVTDDSIEWALDYLGWNNMADSYNLLLFRQHNGDPCDPKLFPQVERHIPGARIIEHNNDMTMILPSSVLEGSIRELNYVLDKFRFFAGVSLPFSDWRMLSDSYSQAAASESHCNPAVPICYGLNYAWDFVLDAVGSKLSEAGMLHPAAAILAAYDRENDTDYLRTLYTYLACERSNVDTAAALFIHRNTLKYRLDKIFEMIDVDLNNINTRMHILVSLMISDK